MFKKNIQNLTRIQTSQKRDVEKGIILDRNERADSYNLKDLKRVYSNFSKNSFNATPDVSKLYDKIANLHKLKESNIYITQGITECISHIIFSLVKNNEEVIIMDPTYPMYEVLLKLNNVKFKKWKFDKNFNLNFSDLLKLINSKTKLIFLVNPNLPIEYEFSENEKKKIYNLCKRKNIILAYDEAYHYFGSKSELKNINKFKNLIIMRTFSKAWGLSGIRLGYMVSNSKITEYVKKCRLLVETNSLSYQVALWAIKNKIYKKHVKLVKSGSNFIRKKLLNNGISFHGGKVTNALLIKLPNKELTNKLKNWLKKRKIYIRANFAYPIDNFVRVSLGSVGKLSIFFREFIKWKKIYIPNKPTF